MAWKKYRKHIIALIIISIVWGILIFSLFFLSKKINSSINDVQEKIINQENEKKRLQEIPKFEDQSNLIQEKEGIVSDLITKDDAVTVIEKLENLAQDTKNQISIQAADNSAQPSTAGGTAAKNTVRGDLPSNNYLDMKIKLTGNYDSLVNFMERIENTDYYSDVISIQIDANSSNDQSSQSSQGSPFGSPAISGQPNNQVIQNPDGEIISNIEIIYYLSK